MTAEEVLAGAAALVERPGGWCQNALTLEDGSVCMLGALMQATGLGINGISTRPYLQAFRAIRQEIGTPDLPAWNNAPEREQWEVGLALRNAKRHVEAI